MQCATLGQACARPCHSPLSMRDPQRTWNLGTLLRRLLRKKNHRKSSILSFSIFSHLPHKSITNSKLSMPRFFLTAVFAAVLLANHAEAQRRCMRFKSEDYVDQAAFNTAVTDFCSTRVDGKQCCTIGDSTVDVPSHCVVDFTKLEYFQICEMSCRGDSACNNIGTAVNTPNSARVSILPDACIGDSACASIGSSSTRLKQVKIKEGACSGVASCCANIALEAGKNVIIGKSSCSAGC